MIQAASDAEAIIARLSLTRHPEGGWYRETWRAPAAAGQRSAGTAIHFLLEQGQRSHWHRVDADELWLWHAGASLRLQIGDDRAATQTVRLGGDVMSGEVPQHRVPAGWWQAAEASDGWALASCVVVPGFDFAGFELAPADWCPGAG